MNPPHPAHPPFLLCLLLAFAGILLPTAAALPASPSAPPPPFPVVATTLHIDGTRQSPAPGSAAGVWFYTAGDRGAQVLWVGHASVPGSWRLTASLNPGDEVQLSLEGTNPEAFPLRFRTEALSFPPLDCQTISNRVTLRAPHGSGAMRLSGFTLGNSAVAFAPHRRSPSRDPVPTSPDLHPAIAEALIEWDWRMQDGIDTPREPRTYLQAIDQLLRRTDALVAERRRLANWTPEEDRAWTGFRTTPPVATHDPLAAERHWLELHRLRRRFVLGNPIFGRNPWIFVKHVPSVMSHQLTQMYGYCSRPGGGIFVLDDPGTGIGAMRTRAITPPSLPPGNFMTPELSPDARTLLFAYCPVRVAPASWDFDERTRHLRYHIHALTLDTGVTRPLTTGDTDNFSPVVLPSGDVLFVSTRRGGFHRCGRGPCFVYTLARMRADGGEARTLSFHETHEWDPCLLNDGRVVYTRWDYVDRNAVHYQQLWSARPDGGNAQIFYGNNTWNPTGLWEARAVPGSSRVMATASAHHGMSAGSVVLLDTSRGVDGHPPVSRLTPDARFPESESPLAFGPNPASSDFDAPITQYWRTPLTDPESEKTEPEEEKRWPGHCYKSPWPVSESFFAVSYSFDRLVGEPGPNIPNMFGLYFADAFGNKELVYRDPAISSLWARPLTPRRPPPDLSPPRPEPGGDTGTFLVHDVRESWPYLPADQRITHLRIVQVLLKTTPHADTPRVGAAFAAPAKQVLGTVPVEEDGSAFFEAPARTPVLFQALNAQGRAVQTMRSLVYLQPGERQSCLGCHEHRGKTPAPQALPIAARRPPSTIRPGPEGSRPFSYPRLVQPVLDRHCVRCHDGQVPNRSVLTGEPEGGFTKSYNALVTRVSFSAWGRPDQNFEPLTEPGRFGAIASPLARLLDQAHGDVILPPEDHERLNTWMDANALFYGTFDPTEQRRQLAGERIEGPRE